MARSTHGEGWKGMHTDEVGNPEGRRPLRAHRHMWENNIITCRPVAV
jgi:hypothetical protein